MDGVVSSGAPAPMLLPPVSTLPPPSLRSSAAVVTILEFAVAVRGAEEATHAVLELATASNMRVRPPRICRRHRLLPVQPPPAVPSSPTSTSSAVPPAASFLTVALPSKSTASGLPYTRIGVSCSFLSKFIDDALSGVWHG
jgi:hypothetical protein